MKKKQKSIIGRTSLAEKIVYNAVFLTLVLYCVCLFYPLFWMGFSSLKDIVDYTLHPFALPKIWHWSNYKEIFNVLKVEVVTDTGLKDVYLAEMIYNSITLSMGGAFLAAFVPSITAYTVAKYRFKFGDILYKICIITMILPIVGSLPSQLRMASALHLTGHVWGVWIMGAGAFGTNFLLMYSAFKSVSWSYAEAAFIDGASHFAVLFRIMMPMIKGTFGAIFMLSFIGGWNDYMTSILYLPNRPTLGYGIFRFQFDAASMGYLMPHILAGFTVSMIPILLLFLLFRDKVMSNMTMGGLKG